jgi:hypothetical protein
MNIPSLWFYYILSSGYLCPQLWKVVATSVTAQVFMFSNFDLKKIISTFTKISHGKNGPNMPYFYDKLQ